MELSYGTYVVPDLYQSFQVIGKLIAADTLIGAEQPVLPVKMNRKQYHRDSLMFLIHLLSDIAYSWRQLSRENDENTAHTQTRPTWHQAAHRQIR
jgi:hypothetical protein